MKKFVTVAAAIAAFGFVNAASAADPVRNWTGFYVGVNAGYGWGNRTVTYSPNDSSTTFIFNGTLGSTPPPPTSFSNSGGLGGLQVGYNWQFNPSWVTGIEADFDWSGIKGSGISNFLVFPTAPFGGPASIQASQNIKWFGTIRGRLGVLPANNTLVYATAGFAYARVDETLALQNGNNFVVGGSTQWICTSGISCFLGGSARTATGWTIGGGLEYAPWNNISVKAEYLYINLGGGDTVNLVAVNSGATPPGSIASAYSRTYFHVVRVGLNYKFGG